MYCLPPTPNKLLNSSPSRDVLEEILPSAFSYVTEDTNGNTVTRDGRADLLQEMRDQWQYEHINYNCVDRWVREAGRYFTGAHMSELGKKMGIYALNRELDVDYSNYTETVTTDMHDALANNENVNQNKDTSGTDHKETISETLPDTPVDSSQYLSDRETVDGTIGGTEENIIDTVGSGTKDTTGTVTRTMKQPSGPLGSASLLKDSMNAINNPLYDFVLGMDKYFIPRDVLDTIGYCGCE